MQYYIIEIQQYEDGTYGHLVHWATSRNQAESKYHEVLAAAAISNLPKHSAVLLSDEGLALMQQTYRHDVIQSEPEVES